MQTINVHIRLKLSLHTEATCIFTCGAGRLEVWVRLKAIETFVTRHDLAAMQLARMQFAIASG